MGVSGPLDLSFLSLKASLGGRVGALHSQRTRGIEDYDFYFLRDGFGSGVWGLVDTYAVYDYYVVWTGGYFGRVRGSHPFEYIATRVCLPT